jgi:ribosomal subunit interface protein
MQLDVDRCADCPPPEIAWSRSAFLYDEPVRAALMRLKFGGMRSVASAFEPPMVSAAGDRLAGRRDGFPVVTWVPLGRRRRRGRGFDQAEILARGVGSRAGRAVAPLLERIHETDPQARRSGTDRRRALSGAFRSIALPPPRVILVDDVLTTGATAQACARTLRRAGAGEIGLLTAARSLGDANGPIPARCYTSARMDLVLKGRGVRITDKVRHAAEHKLAKLARRPRPLVTRIEVEIIGERNPRIGESHRVEVACDTAKHTFRAEGAGPDIDSALDRVVERLERQISDYRNKRLPRKSGRTNRPEPLSPEPPLEQG